MMAATCLGAVIAVQHFFGEFAARMEPPVIFIFLLATAIGAFSVQCMAIYMRSFKREPFLLQSLLVSSLTTVAVLVTTPRCGSWGIALSYLLFTGLLGSTTAVVIFRSKRISHRQRLAAISNGEWAENS
jgi:O-antigen/teichoic acid export membrane protein